MNQPNPNPAQQRRSLMIRAIKEQQETIDMQAGQIRALTHGLASLAVAANVGSHPIFAPIVRAAGLQSVAESADNPDGAPSTTTEQAKKPQATDDVTSPGAVPAEGNKDVTPAAVTDVNNSNVAANPPVLDNLQDVTAPVSGTDSPTPAAATGEGTVNVGTGDQKSFDSTGPSWKASAIDERFMASLRLARLQIGAGLAGGEDLALGTKIAESGVPTDHIVASAETLEAVARQTKAQQAPTTQQRRSLVPRAAAAAPGAQPQQGIQPVALASQPVISAVSSRGEDEWAIGADSDFNGPGAGEALDI